MVKRLFVFMVTTILTTIIVTLRGADFSMVFSLLAILFFYIMGVCVYFYTVRSFKPKDGKMYQFLKMSGYYLICYVIIAIISYLISRKFFTFWDVYRVSIIAFMILGNIHIRFERMSDYKTEYIETTFDSQKRGVRHTIEIHPGDVFVGGNADYRTIQAFMDAIEKADPEGYKQIFGDDTRGDIY